MLVPWALAAVIAVGSAIAGTLIFLGSAARRSKLAMIFGGFVLAARYAGGVPEISRWQAPRARRHRTRRASHSTPAGSRRTGGTPAGVQDRGITIPVAARLRRLPPANVRNASGVTTRRSNDRVASMHVL